jgi:hypothetical protein
MAFFVSTVEINNVVALFGAFAVAGWLFWLAWRWKR